MLESLPADVVAGGVGERVLLRVGDVVLGLIRQAFVTKSNGGTDEAGERWQSLAPTTVAYKRRAGRNRYEKKRPAFPSQALTLRQQKEWWEHYRRALGRHGEGTPAPALKGRAAAIAWFIMKQRGATTLLEKYGQMKVKILRDTGLLLRSLTPDGGASEQVFRIERGAVVVGTSREGALAHHLGRPPHLPQRRLWPPPNRWPARWWRAILAVIVEVTALLVAATARSK